MAVAEPLKIIIQLGQSDDILDHPKAFIRLLKYRRQLSRKGNAMALQFFCGQNIDLVDMPELEKENSLNEAWSFQVPSANARFNEKRGEQDEIEFGVEIDDLDDSVLHDIE